MLYELLYAGFPAADSDIRILIECRIHNLKYLYIKFDVAILTYRDIGNRSIKFGYIGNLLNFSSCNPLEK